VNQDPHVAQCYNRIQSMMQPASGTCSKIVVVLVSMTSIFLHFLARKCARSGMAKHMVTSTNPIPPAFALRLGATSKLQKGTHATMDMKFGLASDDKPSSPEAPGDNAEGLPPSPPTLHIFIYTGNSISGRVKKHCRLSRIEHKSSSIPLNEPKLRAKSGIGFDPPT
jgi:hypothetical protein